MKRLMWVAALLLPAEPAAQDFVMREPSVRFGIQIYGPSARDANPADWPSTFVYRTAGGGPCTSTAIGERVLLTAGHCLGATAAGMIEIGTATHDVECRRHPAYPGNQDADFSLCLVTPALAPPRAGFETLVPPPGATPVKSRIRLLGFGCRVKGGPDRGFGILVEGDATVVSLHGDSVRTGGNAGLCFGDSGGGAYVSSAGDYQKVRHLVAVNARSDGSYSWVSLVGTPLFRTWAAQWSAAQKAAICGLDAQARPCRR